MSIRCWLIIVQHCNVDEASDVNKINKGKQFRNDVDSISYKMAMSKKWTGGIKEQLMRDLNPVYWIMGYSVNRDTDVNSDMKLSSFESLYQA